MHFYSSTTAWWVHLLKRVIIFFLNYLHMFYQKMQVLVLFLWLCKSVQFYLLDYKPLGWYEKVDRNVQ